MYCSATCYCHACQDATGELARIVGFEVEPFSVKHDYEPPWDPNAPLLKTCNPGAQLFVTHEQAPQPVIEGAEVVFTYDVMWQVCSRESYSCM